MRVRDYLDPTRGWRSSSDVDKVRLYTRQSFQLIAALIGIGAVASSIPIGDYVTAVGIAIGSCATVVLVQRIPSLGGMGPGGLRAPLAILVVACGVVIVLGTSTTAVWATALIATPVAALIDLRWTLAAALAATGLAALVGAPTAQAVVLGVCIAVIAGTVHLSMWLLRIVTELEATRDAAAALSVAEERLRFSRDLHDVVGRALSAIAVKSELAATLARRGDERAAAQMDEVRELARESMTDARELVRGYRSIDIASELAGARSLLSAAGIRTEIVGDISEVVRGAGEPSAWLVREGVTNILRHSDATYCRIEFGGTTIRVVNDRPTPAADRSDGTGLTGLRERLAAAGGTLTVDARADTFALTADFPEESA